MSIQFLALPTDVVRAYQDGGPDAYGNEPEPLVSNGYGIPCRHCLEHVREGEPYIVLAYRPFQSVQPYAETGPIFLHANRCDRGAVSGQLPAILSSPHYIVRGYDDAERIVYGTGAVVPTPDIIGRAVQIFEHRRVAFVHVRSARNNCFLCRIERS